MKIYPLHLTMFTELSRQVIQVMFQHPKTKMEDIYQHQHNRKHKVTVFLKNIKMHLFQTVLQFIEMHLNKA